jgi:hypothetical protein
MKSFKGASGLAVALVVAGVALFGLAQITGRGPYNIPPTKLNTTPPPAVDPVVGGQPAVAHTPVTPSPSIPTITTPKVVTTSGITTATPKVVTPSVGQGVTPAVIPPTAPPVGPKVVTPGVPKPSPQGTQGDGTWLGDTWKTWGNGLEQAALKNQAPAGSDLAKLMEYIDLQNRGVIQRLDEITKTNQKLLEVIGQLLTGTNLSQDTRNQLQNQRLNLQNLSSASTTTLNHGGTTPAVTANTSGTSGGLTFTLSGPDAPSLQ